MEAAKENKIHMPEKRQFLILIPFALFYAVAAMCTELEKAASLGLIQNFIRFAAWFCTSYAALLILCTVLSQRSAVMSRIPLLSHVHEQKPRQGKWDIYVCFAGLCLRG